LPGLTRSNSAGKNLGGKKIEKTVDIGKALNLWIQGREKGKTERKRETSA